MTQQHACRLGEILAAGHESAKCTTTTKADMARAALLHDCGQAGRWRRATGLAGQETVTGCGQRTPPPAVLGIEKNVCQISPPAEMGQHCARRPRRAQGWSPTKAKRSHPTESPARQPCRTARYGEQQCLGARPGDTAGNRQGAKTVNIRQLLASG